MSGFVLPAEPGAFALSGASAGPTTPLVLVADPGAFVVDGDAAGLTASGHLLAEPGAFIVSGAAAGIALTVDPVTVLENAIQAWVVAGSGLDDQHVIWTGDGPGGPMPAGTYISMRLLREEIVSQDWLIPRREGTRVVVHARGTRQPTLELSCSSDFEYGQRRPGQILSRVLASLRLPSVRAVLRAGGVGVGVRGPIRTVPGVRSMMFDPKAVCEVGLHTMVDVSEVGADVATVGVQTSVDGIERSGTVAKP